MARTTEGDLDARGMKFALVVSRFNEHVTRRLLAGAEDFLDRHNGLPDDRRVIHVPGAWELPLAAGKLPSSEFDAIIALGALIRGETPHFDVLAQQVARGLAQLSMELGKPVIFGVLTTDNVDQAVERAGGKHGNKGWESAQAAVEMVDLYRRLV